MFLKPYEKFEIVTPLTKEQIFSRIESSNIFKRVMFSKKNTEEFKIICKVWYRYDYSSIIIGNNFQRVGKNTSINIVIRPTILFALIIMAALISFLSVASKSGISLLIPRFGYLFDFRALAVVVIGIIILVVMIVILITYRKEKLIEILEAEIVSG